MNEKHLLYWERVREKGKLRFVLFRGVLCYGIPLAVVMSFVTGGIEFNDIFFRRMWTGLIIYTIGGAFFGLLMWKYNESTYKKYLEKNQEEK